MWSRLIWCRSVIWIRSCLDDNRDRSMSRTPGFSICIVIL